MLLELDLQATDASQVLSAGMHEFIDQLQVRLAGISDVLATDLFARAPLGGAP
jgi:hypothetical protein